MQNFLSILFCLSLFYIAITSRIMSYVTVLALQGAVLTLLMTLPVIAHFSIMHIAIPLTLFVIKTLLIPKYMRKIIVNLDVNLAIEPTIGQFTFLLLTIFSMGAIFVVSNILAKTTPIDIIPFASGFSAIIVGLYIIMFRKKLITHVAGFLVLENGIFLLGTSIAYKLPLIIEIGTLLDVFVVVFLMGIALNKISSTISGFNSSDLGRLKD